jgi:hypothetical protein
MKFKGSAMSKILFKSKAAAIKKKKQILISQELDQKIADIEKRAEKQGVAFPLSEHIEDAIHRLVRSADAQLQEIENSSDNATSLNSVSNHPTA